MDGKFMKRFESFKNSLDLIQYYAMDNFVAGSPREVLKAAFRAELISDDVWMEMLKVRNQLAHDYDGAIVKEYCQRIIGVYIDMLYEFCGKTGKLLQIG